MKLIHNNIIRTEFDTDTIQNLLRKGWVELFVPDIPIPEYNPLTERIEMNSITSSYDIIPLTDSEIAITTFNNSVNAGFLVSPENFYLGLQDEDRNAFTQMMVLLREALEMGLITLQTPQTIKDKEGNTHTITTERFQQIIISYGFYYKTLWETI
jgi:hypothetical protein